MRHGTELGRVRGLGAAHSGTHHWLMQRFTAISNLVLALFLAFSLALLPNHEFTTVRDWVAQPLTATALALFVVSVFWHARLGLQVMIEDYVDVPGNRFAVLAVLNLTFVAVPVFCLFSIARIALGAAA